MKTLFDTSVIIAALVESHPMHGKAFPWLKQAKSGDFDLIVAGHSLAELYAVLSTLPIKPRISPAVAWRLVHENIVTISKVIALTSAEYSDVLKQVSQSGLIGGIVYDALIARVAQKAKVQRLLTFNSEHFRRVWPTGEHIILNP
jgi:predicted nucleic acid-binding protein